MALSELDREIAKLDGKLGPLLRNLIKSVRYYPKHMRSNRDFCEAVYDTVAIATNAEMGRADIAAAIGAEVERESRYI
jgi:hypothetical protein